MFFKIKELKFKKQGNEIKMADKTINRSWSNQIFIFKENWHKLVKIGR